MTERHGHFVSLVGAPPSTPRETDANTDPYHLIPRFVREHASTFQQALREIESGEKVGHWSWFIFPTPPYYDNRGVEAGSQMNKYYALRGDDQVIAYLRFPLVDGVDLRGNYLKIMQAISKQLNQDSEMTIERLVGPWDAPKLISSLETFMRISGEIGDVTIYEICQRTLKLIRAEKKKTGILQKLMTMR